MQLFVIAANICCLTDFKQLAKIN